MTLRHSLRRIVIACGGTGGHLYPGMAVGERLLRRGCAVTLLISTKEVDRQAAKSAAGMEVAKLPAVGLVRGQFFGFLRGFVLSFRQARNIFQAAVPGAALAMGGFTSAPPLLAARRLGAKIFLHESNIIPGRANRWLSWMVDRAFVGFASAAGRLHAPDVVVTGTPVRNQFQPRDAAVCRAGLGLDPDRPVVLVMGGSQGASFLNRLVIQTVPQIQRSSNNWQWLHLTGQVDAERVTQAYASARIRAVVHAYFDAMELALGAATVAISRAGASSLAELAAMRVPAVLLPYPAAVDNHQFHNARALEQSGAARLLIQSEATPDRLARLLTEIMQNAAKRQNIRQALERWHSPAAADTIAQSILDSLETPQEATGGPKQAQHPRRETPQQEGQVRLPSRAAVGAGRGP